MPGALHTDPRGFVLRVGRSGRGERCVLMFLKIHSGEQIVGGKSRSREAEKGAMRLSKQRPGVE